MSIDQSPPGPVEPDYPEPPEPEDHYPPQNNGHRPPSAPVPHDIAAEQYVLGAALYDPRQIETCSTLLTASDFWDPRHETIWRTLVRLHALQQSTQPQAVNAYLLEHEAAEYRHLLNAKGNTYLFDLVQSAGVPADAPEYAARVERLSRRRSAIASLRRNLNRLESPGPDLDVDQALADAASHLAEVREALANLATPTTWSPVDLAPVLKGEYLDPPPTMLQRTDGTALFYDGAVHTISGESESGKTWLTLIAALQLVQADERVVFLDFEDRADRVVGRLLGLGATPDQIRNSFAYVRPDRPLEDDGRTQLAPHLANTRLVIVDGVTEAMTMHGYDLNSNADAALFYGLIPRWIADHGPAVAMIDHVVKNAEQQGRFAIGAQHKLAGIDGAAYTVKTITPFGRGKRGIARVDIAKDRPGHVRGQAHGKVIAEFTLDATKSDVVLIAHLMPPGHETGRAGDTFEPTVLMERVSRLVETNPGLSKKAIEDTVNGKASSIRLAIELLVTRGYIGTKTGARGRIEHFHVNPYRDEEDPQNDPSNQPETTTVMDPWEAKA